ncbi:fimbria/pilus chaperone family protein [uncultured Ralstonia sp.]|uniref:fimbria/pilus chaperone family protein n=1 Tax=Ralstonia sp. TaxID=54061 RepID=UPI0025CF6C38|nr:fimbria/pilus chaperone family protein [uncultured Ralstonia sp.]
MKPIQSNLSRALLGVLLASAAFASQAAGMLPESTVVLINEADGEASMVVTNTDPGPSLLYTTIQSVDEDPKPPVILTPPVARVEPGKKQTVRFMLTNTEPLKVERYARATFDGIPERKPDGTNTVTLTVRQNLPIVMHPKSLPEDKTPWKHLKWSRNGDVLTATNDSAYVVRVDQKLNLMPGNAEVSLPKSYLVPGGKVEVKLPERKGEDGKVLKDDFTQVVMTPFTAYGYAAPPYEAQIGAEGAAK